MLYDDDALEQEQDWEDSGAENWRDDHPNPYGTEDCGDGYLTSDGVFVEY